MAIKPLQVWTWWLPIWYSINNFLQTFLGCIFLLLFCNIIYWLTPYVPQNFFWFFGVWLIIITFFAFQIQFPIKLPLIILKQSCLNLSTLAWYLLTLAAIVSMATPNIFTLILYFLCNVCQFLTLVTSLSFDNSSWLKSFMNSSILFCKLLLHNGSFLSAALLVFTPNLFVPTTDPT